MGVEVHEPDLLHLGQGRRRQGMAANAATEIEHLAAGETLLQAQGIGDVVGAAQMPGCQFDQVGRADGVFVKTARISRIKGQLHRPRVEGRQLVRGLGQQGLQGGSLQLQERGELGLEGKAIGQETLHVQAGANGDGTSARGAGTGRQGHGSTVNRPRELEVPAKPAARTV